MVAINIFELGSLFCAIASSVNFLIFGRVIAGIGAGGICVSVLTIIAEVRFITHMFHVIFTHPWTEHRDSVPSYRLWGYRCIVQHLERCGTHIRR